MRVDLCFHTEGLLNVTVLSYSLITGLTPRRYIRVDETCLLHNVAPQCGTDVYYGGVYDFSPA